MCRMVRSNGIRLQEGWREKGIRFGPVFSQQGGGVGQEVNNRIERCFLTVQ